jgi:hypothetical protein
VLGRRQKRRPHQGPASYIQDQINLRARAVLFGFSYTFGSVHNTIVDRRFGRVDLEED